MTHDHRGSSTAGHSLRHLAWLVLLLVCASPHAALAQTFEVAPLAGYRFGNDLFELAANRSVDTDGAPAVGVPQDDLVTPSGNIECGNIGDRLDCVILQHDFPDGCDSGGRAYVTLELTGMAQFGPCIGDVFGRAQLTPTGYGTVVSLGQFTCDVEQTGVRCTNPEAHGFQLSRAAFSPF